MAVKRTLQRIINCIALPLSLNSVFLFAFIDFFAAAKALAVIALAAYFIRFNIFPYGREKPGGGARLLALIGGRECILTAMACFFFELAAYSAYFIFMPAPIKTCLNPAILIANAVFCALLLAVLVINGFIRIFIASRQAGVSQKLLLLFFWWAPVLNVILLKKLCNSAVKEYVFIKKKTNRNESRSDEAVCKTKYPLLLVHGIFFRDWKGFNYWGRIPKELETNGAVCYYGNQRSSASVAECGEELAECIRRVVSETGCGKLNIIAHSKGGLDSRYAISCLGMGKYIASLTTVCTPHQGCNNVRKILELIPGKALYHIKKNYETLFTALGDEDPDFISGLANLTDTECAALNWRMIDDPQVYYRSVGAKMGSRKSAVFPLSLGYSVIKSTEGDNDGLVAVDSMQWGDFLGIVAPSGKQGISHGDIIDLTRKDVEGFDVCEFYVDMVSRLKVMGM